MKQLTKGNQKSLSWAVHPAHAKELTELGFDFKTMRFPDRKPVEEGKDYSIPGPDYIYEETEARQAEAAKIAGVPNLPQSTVTYYDKAFVANWKAQTPFMNFGTKQPLPAKSGTAYKMYSFGSSND